MSNSIHLHVNGDMNINLTLPDRAESMDCADCQKPVDLNPAADFLCRLFAAMSPESEPDPEDADPLMMVMHPGRAPEIVLKSECSEMEDCDFYDRVEALSDDSLADSDLQITFNSLHFLSVNHKRYLQGPVIVFKCDEDGDDISLSAEDMIAIAAFFRKHTETLCLDGTDIRAFQI